MDCLNKLCQTIEHSLHPRNLQNFCIQMVSNMLGLPLTTLPQTGQWKGLYRLSSKQWRLKRGMDSCTDRDMYTPSKVCIFRGWTLWFVIFFGISMVMHVTVCDVCMTNRMNCTICSTCGTNQCQSQRKHLFLFKMSDRSMKKVTRCLLLKPFSTQSSITLF